MLDKFLLSTLSKNGYDSKLIMRLISERWRRQKWSAASWRWFQLVMEKKLKSSHVNNLEIKKIMQQENVYISKTKNWLALAGWLSWLQHLPIYQKVVGSIPDQSTHLHCGFNPWSGHVWEASYQYFFLSLHTPFLSI